VIFFSYILGYSRRQWIEVVEDKTQRTLFECLVHAFMYFDGVAREIKSDNQKGCVDRWECGQPIFNRHYLSFASHYGFRPLAIHPGKPMENLKVERPFYYLEMNFLNGRRFRDKNDLKEQLLNWLTQVNDVRVHRTTRRRPIDLFGDEIPCLVPLPAAHLYPPPGTQAIGGKPTFIGHGTRHGNVCREAVAAEKRPHCGSQRVIGLEGPLLYRRHPQGHWPCPGSRGL